MLKVIEGGTPPKIKTKYSSSADLCSRVDIVIGAGETKVIPLGVKIDLDTFIKENSKLFEMNFYESDEAGDDGTHYGICGEKVDEFLKSHFLELKIRSSLSIKGLIVANGVGEIDIDYPDEIGLIVHNPVGMQKVPILEEQTILEDRLYLKSVNIKAGERVAQIKLMEHKNFLMPDRFRNEDIRTGGFGSTN